MVFPEEVPEVGRVRIVRNAEGRIYGFQDPDRGSRFITREEAVRRLRYETETATVVDSFGNRAGPGSVSFPESGVVRALKNRTQEYQTLRADPSSFAPNPNQELVERIVFVRKDGTLVVKETSYGLGKDYAPAKRGGWFRSQAANALEVPSGKRLPTADLQRAVLRREFLVKTTT